MSSRAQLTSVGEKVSIRPSSSASGSRSLAAIGRISMAPLQRDLYEPHGQRGIIDPGGRRALGEPCVRMEVAIGVDVDHVWLALRREPDIHAAVIAAVERIERGHR